MLPKKHRLTDDYDFRRVRRLGRVFNTPLFSVSLAKSKIPGNIRFGFVLSNKISKRAVDRNRAKRILREVAMEKLKRFPPGFDIVFFSKRSLIGRSYEEVSFNFDKVLSEISQKKASLQV